MLFNSFSFLVFIAVLLLFLVIAQSIMATKEKDLLTLRNAVLLAASYYFYAFLEWRYLFLLLSTTLVNYIVARQLGNTKSESGKKKWLLFAVIFSIGVLGYFKYANFFVDSVLSALGYLGISPQLSIAKIVLPIGISFFTFQALSYTLDVYNGKMHSRKNFIDVALYVSFFPTILSGPIERGRNLIPQIEKYTALSLEGLVEGGKLFLWGLFTKIVVADRLAAYINVVYGGNIDNFSSSTFLFTAIFYSFQIYADFSGYSSMAIGVGRMLGFKLMTNFQYPYFSTSIKGFWKRWHISLTSWFTEYVYIPLGGNRVSEFRWLVNISVVFLLSGLWHGANWTFILWGALHAIYYLLEHYFHRIKPAWLKSDKKSFRLFSDGVSVLLVFGLVTIAWVFFRVEDFSKACSIVARFVDSPGSFYWGASAFTTLLAIAVLVIFLGMEWVKYKQVKMSMLISALVYSVVLAMTVLLGVTSGGFVYFQF